MYKRQVHFDLVNGLLGLKQGEALGRVVICGDNGLAHGKRSFLWLNQIAAGRFSPQKKPD